MWPLASERHSVCQTEGDHIDGELFVRLASEDDLNAVVLLLEACIAAMRRSGIDQWDELYPNHATLLTDIRARTMHLGFQDRETLVGALVLNEIQNAEWSAAQWMITGVPILVVHRLMVDPQHQGKGVARDLMRFSETWARTNGYGGIRLDAFSANPRALRLYRGLGYRDAGGASFRKGPFRCFEKQLNAGAG
jgi:GNAT superfamily N-acetyltransferase